MAPHLVFDQKRRKLMFSRHSCASSFPSIPLLFCPKTPYSLLHLPDLLSPLLTLSLFPSAFRPQPSHPILGLHYTYLPYLIHLNISSPFKPFHKSNHGRDKAELTSDLRRSVFFSTNTSSIQDAFLLHWLMATTLAKG